MPENETNEIVMSKETIQKARKSVEEWQKLADKPSVKVKLSKRFINKICKEALKEDLILQRHNIKTFRQYKKNKSKNYIKF